MKKSELKSCIDIMDKVFEDMDKDFTIWEYRKEIKTLLDYAKNTRHTPSIEDIERVIAKRVDYTYGNDDCYMIGKPKELARAMHDKLGGK